MMRNYSYVYLWLLLAIMLAGCGRLSGSDTELRNAQTPGPEAAYGLPIPEAVLAGPPSRKPSVVTLALAGKDFDVDHVQRVSAQGDDALFTPAWTGNTSPFTDLAYALYWFNPFNFTGPQTCSLTWSNPPADLNNLWIGFSSWQGNHWDWRRGAASGVPLAPVDIPFYTRPGGGVMIVAVVVLGEQQCSLSEVRLGASLAGGWRMYGHDAQHTHRSEAVSSQTGMLNWQFKSTAGGPAFSAVFDVSNTAYVYSANSATNSDQGDLYAINPDGSLKWSYHLMSTTHCVPALGYDGTLFFGGSNGLIALDQAGNPLWSYSGGHNYEYPIVLTQQDDVIVSSQSPNGYLESVSHNGLSNWWLRTSWYGSLCGPVLAPDGTAYISGVPGYLVAVTAPGEKSWEYNTETTSGSNPAVALDGTVYIGAYSATGDLHAINPDGTQKWCAHFGHYLDAGPAIGADGSVYMNSDDGLLYALSADGAVLWSASAGGESSAAIGADGVIYVGGLDFRLHAFNPDGTELWQSDPAGGEFSDPAIADDGTLVVGCADGWIRAYSD